MSTYEIRHGGVSDIGNVRPTNQDRLLVDGGLVVVADGMGGHNRGEVASRLAVDAVREAFAADPSAEGLVDAVRHANRTVWAQADADPDLHGMGTTIAAVALVPAAGAGSKAGSATQLAVVNVGDSRAYLFRDGRLTRLSSDHSMVADLVRAGEIREDEARVHPMRHVLTHAVGVAPEVEPHVAAADPERGDRLLLCSDGLFNEVDHGEIGEVLATVDDPDAAAARLVELANDHGGNDNITAVVVDLR